MGNTNKTEKGFFGRVWIAVSKKRSHNHSLMIKDKSRKEAISECEKEFEQKLKMLSWEAEDLKLISGVEFKELFDVRITQLNEPSFADFSVESELRTVKKQPDLLTVDLVRCGSLKTVEHEAAKKIALFLVQNGFLTARFSPCGMNARFQISFLR